MILQYTAFNKDTDKLVQFLTSETWEFFGTPNPKEEVLRKYYDSYYEGEGIKSFWIYKENEVIGLIRMYDLDDGGPMFDLRLLKKYRGNGFGTMACRWIVEYIFTNYEEVNRIEGDTRADNFGMRSVFSKSGFVKEAHYRDGWVMRNGDTFDTVGYGILRRDWKKGETTPVKWNDFNVPKLLER